MDSTVYTLYNCRDGVDCMDFTHFITAGVEWIAWTLHALTLQGWSGLHGLYILYNCRDGVDCMDSTPNIIAGMEQIAWTLQVL